TSLARDAALHTASLPVRPVSSNLRASIGRDHRPAQRRCQVRRPGIVGQNRIRERQNRGKLRQCGSAAQVNDPALLPPLPPPGLGGGGGRGAVGRPPSPPPRRPPPPPLPPPPQKAGGGGEKPAFPFPPTTRTRLPPPLPKKNRAPAVLPLNSPH